MSDDEIGLKTATVGFIATAGFALMELYLLLSSYHTVGAGAGAVIAGGGIFAVVFAGGICHEWSDAPESRRMLSAVLLGLFALVAVAGIQHDIYSHRLDNIEQRHNDLSEKVGSVNAEVRELNETVKDQHPNATLENPHIVRFDTSTSYEWHEVTVK